MPIRFNDGTVTHVGRVIEVFSKDYRAMSDVYTLATFALVLDDDDKIRERLVNANFECDQNGGRAEVDATSDVIAVHQRILAEAEELRRKSDELRLKAEEERVRNVPRVGKRMKVVSGRDHVGHEGTVAFVREGRVLLKPHHLWKDRNANGVWVRDINLKVLTQDEPGYRQADEP